MTATVIPFVSAPATGPLRFTPAARQFVLAIGYRPGVSSVIGADDDGDEWAAISADGDEFEQLDPVSIIVQRGGFKVSCGWCEAMGEFEAIADAVTAAREVLAQKIAAFDCAAYQTRELTTWTRILCEA